MNPLERRAEHFNHVITHPVVTNEETIIYLPKMEISQDIDNFPTEEVW